MITVSLLDICARDFCSFFCFCSSTHAKASKSILRIEPRFTTIPARFVDGREHSCPLQVRPLPCEQGLAKGDLSFPEAGLHRPVAIAEMQLQHPPSRSAHCLGRSAQQNAVHDPRVLRVTGLGLGPAGKLHWAS